MELKNSVEPSQSKNTFAGMYIKYRTSKQSKLRHCQGSSIFYSKNSVTYM